MPVVQVHKPLSARALTFHPLARLPRGACHVRGAQGVPIGERVTFKGCPGEPLPFNQVNKKKVFEAVQPPLGTSGDCVALYKDLPFETTKGVCKVASIANGGIK